MSRLTKRLLKPIRATLPCHKLEATDEECEDRNQDGIDIISMLWERNMTVVVRHIFLLSVQPGHVGACRQVCRLWNSILEREFIRHLPHLQKAHKWMNGQVQVTDLDYLGHLGDLPYDKVDIHLIVPLERFTFILLTRHSCENVLMVYEVKDFKACIILPVWKIRADQTLIKLGRNTVNIITNRFFDNSYTRVLTRGDYFCTIISLDDYEVLLDKFSFSLTKTSLYDFQRMHEPVWNNFRCDGSLEIRVLSPEKPFYEVAQIIPKVNTCDKLNEKVVQVTFQPEVTNNKQSTHMAVKTSIEGYYNPYYPVKLVNLVSKKSEYVTDRKEMKKLNYPTDRYFLTENYFIYAIWDKDYSTITLTIKGLSDGSEKKIKLVNPTKENVVQYPEWAPTRNIDMCGTVPGSNVVMLSLVNGADWNLFPFGNTMYFVDMDKGVLIGGENAGIFLNSDALPKVRITKNSAHESFH